MKKWIFLIAIAAFALSACSSDTANQNSVANTAAQATPTPAPTPSTSPTEAIRALNEASKAKDVERIKSLLSSGTIALLEESAERQKKTVDELLQDDDGAPLRELPELGKEEITGEVATVEIKNEDTDKFEKMPLVIENGEWKVAIDQYLRNFEEQLAEDMKEPPSASSNANKGRE